MANFYPFDHAHDTSPRRLVDLLGHRGAALSEMSSVLDLPVVPGYVATTEAHATVVAAGDFPSDLMAEAHAANEVMRGSSDGHGASHRLFTMWPSPPRPMPGVFGPIQSLGLTDDTVEEMATLTGDPHFAWDNYRRLIQRYGEVVFGIPPKPFDERLAGALHLFGVQRVVDLPVEALQLLSNRFKQVVIDAGHVFPQDRSEQAITALRSFFELWESPAARLYRHRLGLAPDAGMAVCVERMVFGNRDDRSGTGVAYSRNPTTGAPGIHGLFVPGGQVVDLADGGGQPLAHVADQFPEAHGTLEVSLSKLEAAYRDMVSVEFTIEQERLWLIDGEVADRSGVAAVRVAVASTDAGDLGLTPAEAVSRVTAEHVDQILHPQFDDETSRPIATGLGASPGAAVGAVYFGPDEAVDAYDRGEDVILVKDETSPEDVHGMSIAEGILTTRGGLASHAAVVARGWGKPAVCGAGDIRIEGDRFVVHDIPVRAGDLISIDGTTGEVFLGAIDLTSGEPPKELDQILAWADEVRAGMLDVRANADTADDAATARANGAEGIGLCRTEHQFLGERLPLIRRVILAETADDEAAALQELGAAQRDDFRSLLEAMDGLPVTVRLLDPPLHEFLPSVEELVVEQARGALSPEGVRLLDAARQWQEENPMIGTRGVRLGILKPDLYRMQVRALLEAAADRRAAGGDPQLEIMVPLIVNRQELELVAEWIAEELEIANQTLDEPLEVLVGTMIETPRAAIAAGDVVVAADFFSFGTNDLTQMTFGFSRDDVESRVIRRYLDLDLLPANPFESIDTNGVGELVRWAAGQARDARPDIKLGVCGEHGGDPASIRLFCDAGLDYVSCSPYRVPIARLAAAHAVLAGPSRSAEASR